MGLSPPDRHLSKRSRLTELLRESLSTIEPVSHVSVASACFGLSHNHLNDPTRHK